MTKNQFRTLVLLSFVLIILGVIADLTNPIYVQVTEYVDSLEPEWSKTKAYTFVGFGVFAISYLIYTLVGLLLFWNTARHIYLAGFIVFIPFYFGAGINVSSPIGGFLYDTSSILSGMIIALIYFSPVKQYFTR